MIISEEDYLAHYGILRKSGRYPYGSGGPENGGNKSFLDYVADLKKQGLSETQIAEGMGVKTTELRAAKTIARAEIKAQTIATAEKLQAKGYSTSAIGREMGINESSVRGLLSEQAKLRNQVLTSTAGVLKDAVAEKNYVDIGSGVENHMAVTKTKLANAVAICKEDGYKVWYVKVPQVGTAHETTIKVLAKPDSTYSEVFKNRYQIAQVVARSDDGGVTYSKPLPPLSIDSKRIGIKYADEGGTDADGVMYVRPGVSDVSLGGSRYAQVRVAVNGTHFIKGMAVYKDDLPDGVDILFNTNKTNTGNKLDALKSMKDDPDNPFGAIVSQIKGVDAKGKPVVTSVMNIVNKEGQWDDWGRNLSSQFLSKQSPVLAKTQLAMTKDRKKSEFDEIMSLTNPTIKKRLLDAFADDVDSSAVHLHAASLPRQRTQVILPVSSLKDNEVYAPNFRNGERVALVRYPHGGTFEIPELVVNNTNSAAKGLIGASNKVDAIGINAKVAERLSGADFDGDTVVVIPNNGGKVKSTAALARLKNFSPQTEYRAYDGMKTIDGGSWDATKRKAVFPEGKAPSGKLKQVEMGKVSNLITDMTIRKASSDELARAVRHSMVVIDAEKHSLDYRRSAQDHGIAALKAKYQADIYKPESKGASTLISRASSELRVNDRKDRPVGEGGAIDKATGERRYVDTGKTYVNKNGEVVTKTIKTTRLAEARDANALSSGTVIEKIYADHSNSLKALANQARKAAYETTPTPYNPSAKVAYADQVKSLNTKLNVALRNAPIERQAQLLANATISAKRAANPNMEASELKKVKSLAITDARNRTGAGKIRVQIEPEEWKAIQAGAISTTKLDSILTNADLDSVKKLATPRTPLMMTSSKKAAAASMAASGYTQVEIADALGVSLTTLKEGIQ